MHVQHSNVKTLFLLSVLLLTNSDCLNILVITSPLTFSHARILHPLSAALVDRGHKVTTVRYKSSYVPNLRDLGANYTEMHLCVNNSDGAMTVVTKVLK